MEFKLSFISQDVSGREIELRDSTGLKVYGKEFGYSDSDISKIKGYIILFSRIMSSVYHKGVIKRSDSRYDIDKIARGKSFKINSSLFKENYSDGNCSSEIFNDGVLDINSYVVMPGQTGVVGEGGHKFITGGSFADLKDVDAIIVGEDVYNIDDVSYTNGGTVIYLVEPLKEDIDSFDVAYRSNIKALLLSVRDNRQAYAANMVYEMASSQRTPLLDKIQLSDIYAESSKHFFAQEDYYKSDKLSAASMQLLNKFTI